MKLALFTVFALVACLQGSSWMRKHRHFKQSQEKEMWLNTNHMGSVKPDCNQAFYTNPNGVLAAMDTVLTSEENDDGTLYFWLQTFFNNDISACDLPDSGLEMRMYMGSSSMFDVDAPYPEGRAMDELDEDLPENGEDFKRIYRDCEQNLEEDRYPFCGKVGTEQNWFSAKSNEKNGEGLNYVLNNYFNNQDLNELQSEENGEFVVYDEVSVHTQDNDLATFDRMIVPLSLQWWYTTWNECSAFMNFDFTVQINKDMNVDRTSRVQMQIIEVKNSGCKPDGACHVIRKASAKPVFIQTKTGTKKGEVDWDNEKTNNKFAQGHDLYIKYVLKNKADWEGMAMKMTQFACTRGTRPAQYVLLTRNMETDDLEYGDDRFPEVEIIEDWVPEKGEVWMRVPALEGTGKRGSYVFYGSFAIMKWDDEADDFADKVSFDDIPASLGGGGEYMTYRENVAANKGRRRRLDDDKVTVSEFSSGEMLMVDGDSAEEGSGNPNKGFWGWLMGLLGFGYVMGVAALKLKGFYNADAQHSQFE